MGLTIFHHTQSESIAAGEHQTMIAGIIAGFRIFDNHNSGGNVRSAIARKKNEESVAALGPHLHRQFPGKVQW